METPAAPAASQVAQFYSGKTVFLTGATGFMGKVNKGQLMRKIEVRCSHRPSSHIVTHYFVKVLLEKLLRSTNVAKIYVLIRPKKGVETGLRLKQLLSARIFDRVKEESEDTLSRVEVVTGDITEENFGIADEEIR